MQISEIMRQVELFRGLSELQLGQIEAISSEQHFENGAMIFEQGSRGDGMYIVCDGQVEVQVRDNSGATFAAVYLGSGQVFGEMALVDESTRSASVLAVGEDTVVIAIPSVDFTALCQRDNAIGYVMMRNIAQDLSFKLRHRDFDPSSS